MADQTPLHISPADETIRLGPLAVRFLLTADHSNGSLAAFEVLVPAAQRLAAPAHIAAIMRRHGLTPAPPPPQA